MERHSRENWGVSEWKFIVTFPAEIATPDQLQLYISHYIKSRNSGKVEEFLDDTSASLFQEKWRYLQVYVVQVKDNHFA